MQKLNEWAKGKPPGLVIMAQQLAVGAELCIELLKLINAGQRIEGRSLVIGLMNGLVHMKIIGV